MPKAPFVECRGLSKAFGHVVALSDVDIDLREAEVLAIVGDNGAGKSTLIKILSGVHQPDRGEIRVGGEPTGIANPHHARGLGIATVFQNLALVDQRDVAANLFLGREPVRGRFFVDRKAMLEGARKVLGELRVHMPSLTAEVGELSGGQRQSIAIGRATAQHGRIIIMDEPTAALGVQESQKVLDLIARLKAAGTGVVVVSHNMRHVFSVADRIAVFRRGRCVGQRMRESTTPDEIVKLIVGAAPNERRASSVQPCTPTTSTRRRGRAAGSPAPTPPPRAPALGMAPRQPRPGAGPDRGRALRVLRPRDADLPDQVQPAQHDPQQRPDQHRRRRHDLSAGGRRDRPLGGVELRPLDGRYGSPRRRGRRSPWLALPVVVALGAAMGAVTGLIVVRLGIPSFIVTLAMLVGYRSLALIASAERPLTVRGRELFYQVTGGDLWARCPG